MPICEAKGCEANAQEQRLIDGRMGWVCDNCKHKEQIEYLEFPGWKDAPTPAKPKSAKTTPEPDPVEEAAPNGLQDEVQAEAEEG